MLAACPMLIGILFSGWLFTSASYQVYWQHFVPHLALHLHIKSCQQISHCIPHIARQSKVELFAQKLGLFSHYILHKATANALERTHWGRIASSVNGKQGYNKDVPSNCD